MRLRIAIAAGLGLVALAAAARVQERQGTRFGFGRPASVEEIARIDIDVMPDGTGLPEGRGTVAEGEGIYQEKCLACHGPTGREGPNDRLVGRIPRDAFPFANDRDYRLTIGNYWPYATTLYDYLNRAMPFDRPGSLMADEVYSLVALLLYWNKIIPEDFVMNRETLPGIQMPARDRFVPDNRTGGPIIR